MIDFINRYIETGDLNGTFTQAFKSDFPTVEKQLRAYIANYSYTKDVMVDRRAEGDLIVLDLKARIHLSHSLFQPQGIRAA